MYHPQGKIAINGSYLNGQEIGVWEHFDEQGKAVKNVTYQRGKVVEEQVLR